MHVPMQRGHQPVRTHNDRSLRELVVVLLDTLEVFSSRVRLADSSRSQVQDPVPVPTDIGVELGHAEICPVSSDHREDMTKGIRPTSNAYKYADLRQAAM